MIIGQRGIEDRKTFYFSQENNVPETFLQKILNRRYLETCGATSATMGCYMMAADTKALHPAKSDRWQCQPEDYLFLYLNDSTNYNQFLKDRANLSPAKYPGNRIPQYYPHGIKAVFGLDSFFTWESGANYWISEIRKNNVVMICLKKPGHFILLVKYDTVREEFIFCDPWPTRKGLKNRGFMEHIAVNDLMKNVNSYSVVVENQRPRAASF